MNAKAPMILERNFQPGFRIALHRKDLTNAMLASKAVQMELPFTKLALSMMDDLQEQGKDQLDHSALIQYYEERNGIEVSR